MTIKKSTAAAPERAKYPLIKEMFEVLISIVDSWIEADM